MSDGRTARFEAGGRVEGGGRTAGLKRGPREVPDVGDGVHLCLMEQVVVSLPYIPSSRCPAERLERPVSIGKGAKQ